MSVSIDSLVAGVKKRQPKIIGRKNFRDLQCGSAVRTVEMGKMKEKRASVALVLRQGNRGCELLLIRRAERPRDPWSGDVALPGGGVEESESDLEAAIRECQEEVGLNLSGGGFSYVGQLDDRIARRTPGTRLVLSSFVFAAQGAMPSSKPSGPTPDGHGAWQPLALQPSEVADAWWCDVGEALLEDNGRPLAELPTRVIPVSRSVPLLRTSAFWRALVRWLGLDEVAFPCIPLPPPPAPATSPGGHPVPSPRAAAGTATPVVTAATPVGSGGTRNVGPPLPGQGKYVLWGLTLSVVADLVAPVVALPLPRAELSAGSLAATVAFRFHRAPWAIDAAARAVVHLSGGSGGGARRGAAAAAIVVAAVVTACVAGGTTATVAWKARSALGGPFS